MGKPELGPSRGLERRAERNERASPKEEHWLHPPQEWLGASTWAEGRGMAALHAGSLLHSPRDGDDSYPVL